ncbi:cation:proton antiporter [Sphingobacteriaceae bacterium AH-315-L07]|nr:cation:proton antiporter [Sphingobacteriaceae bacterium AH-315-L07]
MEVFNSYFFIIAVSVIIILSYFFNILSKKTSVPSVLMLILTGILIKAGMSLFEIEGINLFPLLEVLGIVGLIMIVLEAALDLELKREKWTIIWKSFTIALLGLIATAFAIAFVIHYFIEMSRITALIYAIPLAIVSSAIVIPSVLNLEPNKKEFMIYESTFADILGIMFFYLLIGNADQSSVMVVLIDVSINVFFSVFVSIIASYALVLTFQHVKTKVKLFLLIAVLLLLYSIGKLLHHSALLIILIFGLVLHNHKVLFRGFLRKWTHTESIENILDNFRMITLESSFVVRTFFFVIFGMTLSLGSLVSVKVFFISALVVGIIYAIRFLFLKSFLRRDFRTLLYIAPRGLVTILLFFTIPHEFQVEEFDSGILLFTILATSIIMTFSLFNDKKMDQAEADSNEP